MKKEDRERLNFKDDWREADYYITDHRVFVTETPEGGHTIFEPTKFGIPIVTVYKLGPIQHPE